MPLIKFGHFTQLQNPGVMMSRWSVLVLRNRRMSSFSESGDGVRFLELEEFLAKNHRTTTHLELGKHKKVLNHFPTQGKENWKRLLQLGAGVWTSVLCGSRAESARDNRVGGYVKLWKRPFI